MKIEFANQFKNDLKKIRKSKYFDSFLRLYNIVINNPYQTPPPYEKLKGLCNKYSRRLNGQHKLVYDIYNDKITFLRCWGHYDD